MREAASRGPRELSSGGAVPRQVSSSVPDGSQTAGPESPRPETHVLKPPADGSEVSGYTSKEHGEASHNRLMQVPSNNREGVTRSDMFSDKSVRGSMEAGRVMEACSLPLAESERFLLERVATMSRLRKAQMCRTIAVPEDDAAAGLWRSVRRRGVRQAAIPSKIIICALCNDLLHFPAQLPCGDLVCFECLCTQSPLATCPGCGKSFDKDTAQLSLNDIVVPEAVQRKVDRGRQSFLLKSRKERESRHRRRSIGCWPRGREHRTSRWRHLWPLRWRRSARELEPSDVRRVTKGAVQGSDD